MPISEMFLIEAYRNVSSVSQSTDHMTSIRSDMLRSTPPSESGGSDSFRFELTRSALAPFGLKVTTHRFGRVDRQRIVPESGSCFGRKAMRVGRPNTRSNTKVPEHESVARMRRFLASGTAVLHLSWCVSIVLGLLVETCLVCAAWQRHRPKHARRQRACSVARWGLGARSSRCAAKAMVTSSVSLLGVTGVVHAPQLLGRGTRRFWHATTPRRR